MYNNRHWVWHFQDKPVMKTLYDGFFNIVSSASSDSAKEIIDVSTLGEGGLQKFASLYNIRTVGGVITDAFTWGISKWNDQTKFWNGSKTSQDNEFFRRYILMKTNMFGRQFSITLIKQCLDILLGTVGTDYECEVIENESSYSFEINITVYDPNVAAVFASALTIDPIPFGKPSGYSYVINVTQG